MSLRSGVAETSLGTFHILVKDGALVRIGLPNDTRRARKAWTGKWFPDVEVVTDPDHRLILRTARQLAEYADGQRHAFALPLDPRGAPFHQAVWRHILGIGYGDTTTYADVAIDLERPLALRAVHQATNRNPLPVVVPCHRVVERDEPGSYVGGEAFKRRLLRLERKNMLDFGAASVPES